jgi:hypothetical protein
MAASEDSDFTDETIRDEDAGLASPFSRIEAALKVLEWDKSLAALKVISARMACESFIPKA